MSDDRDNNSGVLLPRLLVVAPTFYTDTSDLRYRLGLEACRKAVKYGIHLILIDASPSQEVKDGLIRATENTSCVRVVTQTSRGRKGAALRDGIQEALRVVGATMGPTTTPIAASTVVIGFQELEKVDLFRHWNAIVKHMADSGCDVCVPRRREEEFIRFYPIEQYHSEMFANYMLDSYGSTLKLTNLDWTNGPVAFRATQAVHWLEYTLGDLWDAQLVPLVNAHLAGAKISSFEIDYVHPQEMKNMEQGVAEWSEKRLFQLNTLKESVGQRMKAAAIEKMINVVL